MRLPQPPLGTLMYCESLQTLPNLTDALLTAPAVTLSGDTLSFTAQGVEWTFQRTG